MKPELKGTQKLYLWCLIGNGGEGFVCEQPVELTAPDRKSLQAAGLVESGQRKRPQTGRKANYASLTDRGWAWAAEHLHDHIDSRSTKGGQVLSLMLKRLGAFLEARSLSLADLIIAETTPGSSHDGRVESAENRVRAAILELSEGKFGKMVRFALLRKALPDLSREELDSVLNKFQADGNAVLVGFSNPGERTIEDDDAAIDILGVGKRHFVILEH